MKSIIAFTLLTFLLPSLGMTEDEIEKREDLVRESPLISKRTNYGSIASNYNSSDTFHRYDEIGEPAKQSLSTTSHGMRDLDIEVISAPSVGEPGWQFRFGLSLTDTKSIPASSIHTQVPEFSLNDSGVRLGAGYKLWRFYGDFSLVGLILGGAQSSNKDFKIEQGLMYELDAGFEFHKNFCLELFFKEASLEATSTRAFDSWTVNIQRQVLGSRLRIRFEAYTTP